MRGWFAKDSEHWVKTVGLYMILILAALRFLIYPLHAAVRDRGAMLADQQETYRLKSRLLDQAREMRDVEAPPQQDRAPSALYPREMRVSEIQADILAALSQHAEGSGLTVLGFEMPETVVGKTVSEVTVVLRLTGGAGSFIELLKGIGDHQKTLAVRAMEMSASGRTLTFSLTAGAFRMER